MTTISYIEAVGDLIRRRLWAFGKFGTLDDLKMTWNEFLDGEIDAAAYHQQAADCLNYASLRPVPIA